MLNTWNVAHVLFDLCTGVSLEKARGRAYRRCAETCLASYQTQPSKQSRLALCNHVSWCDMFVDALVIDPTRSFYVARRGTMALPMVAALNLCDGACLFRKGSDRKALYDTIHRWYKQGRIPIVYPEGTRNPTLRRLPLKLGMVKLAYDRDIPIVIYISSGKERVINERVRFVARELTKVETRVSDVLGGTKQCYIDAQRRQRSSSRSEWTCRQNPSRTSTMWWWWW